MSMSVHWTRLQRAMIKDMREALRKMKERVHKVERGMLVPTTVVVPRHTRPRKVVQQYSYTTWRKA